MKAFILAGGFATRLWPLTERRAKPLLKVAGKPLISYVAESVPADIPVTVSTNAAFGDDFKAWQKESGRKNLNVFIEDAGHEDQKLGALGALARWVREEKIDDDVLLLAGDNYADWNMAEFLGLFQGTPLIAGHDIGDLDAARKFGTIVLEKNSPLSRLTTNESAKADERGVPGEGQGVGAGGGGTDKVLSFEEKPSKPKSTIVSTGFSILPKATLPVLLEYAAKHPDNIGGIFEEFLRRSMPVNCFVFHGLWKDIGSFEAYLALHRDVVGDKVIAHQSAAIDAGSTLKGAIDLGPKTRIVKSVLTDCIVFGDAVIDDCVLTRCIIDEGCLLKGVDLTDKMIRAGTTLSQS